MGASFGASRALVFKAVQSEQQFSFPQNNGDVFAFDSRVNKQFQHGVPKVTGKSGPRFSIIAWVSLLIIRPIQYLRPYLLAQGRRRTLNERNGGGTDERASNPAKSRPVPHQEEQEPEKKATALDLSEVTTTHLQVARLVNEFIQAKESKKAPAVGRGKER